MFGYVKPLESELKVKEAEFYKSVYCGLCHTNGRRTGCASRFTLSYDLVFLALLRMGFDPDPPDITLRRCARHPCKKRPVTASGAAMDYAASAGAVLALRNLDDKISDSRGLRRLQYRASALLFGKMRRHVRGYGALCREVDDCLARLHKLEKEHCPLPDSAADCFGDLLSAVFSHGLDGSAARIMKEAGRHTGRWIYFTDAADDLPSDRKSGNYNPFLCGDAPNRDRISHAMTLELDRLSRAVSLIPFSDAGIRSITENIIYLGMPACMEHVLNKTLPLSDNCPKKEDTPSESASYRKHE